MTLARYLLIEGDHITVCATEQGRVEATLAAIYGDSQLRAGAPLFLERLSAGRTTTTVQGRSFRWMNATVTEHE